MLEVARTVKKEKTMKLPLPYSRRVTASGIQLIACGSENYTSFIKSGMGKCFIVSAELRRRLERSAFIDSNEAI